MNHESQMYDFPQKTNGLILSVCWASKTLLKVPQTPRDAKITEKIPLTLLYNPSEFGEV